MCPQLPQLTTRSLDVTRSFDVIKYPVIVTRSSCNAAQWQRIECVAMSPTSPAFNMENKTTYKTLDRTEGQTSVEVTRSMSRYHAFGAAKFPQGQGKFHFFFTSLLC